MYIDLSKLDWKDFVIALMAIYGAVLSTINLVNNIKNGKSFIKVELSWGMLTFTNTLQIFITAKNPSNKSITLSSMGLILPNKKQLVYPHPQSNVVFPYELETGKDCMVWSDASSVANHLVREGFKRDISLIGFYKDQLGRIYKSKKLKVNVETMLKE